MKSRPVLVAADSRTLPEERATRPSSLALEQGGGRTTLTPLGHELVRRFRCVERAAADAAQAHLDAFQAAVVAAIAVPELGA